MKEECCVYILTNANKRVLYTGVTSDLKRRIYEHKYHLVKGFSGRYNAHRLVYYEVCGEPEQAITREKQIKAGSRLNKLNLIRKFNPGWKDLYDEI